MKINGLFRQKKMPHDSPSQSPIPCGSLYSTNTEQDSDPEFPPIRIGNDPPLALQPILPPPHPNRYRLNQGSDHKIQVANNSKVRSDGTLTTSRALNNLSSSASGKTGKKVNLHIFSYGRRAYFICSGCITIRMLKIYRHQSGNASPSIRGMITGRAA